MDAALERYRQENPQSRAVARTTVYGSGGRQGRVSCVACRRQIDTWDKRYPVPRHVEQRIDEHLASCEEWKRLEAEERMNQQLKIFMGPNGYYVAREDERGFHKQPADGGARIGFDRAKAEREREREERNAE